MSFSVENGVVHHEFLPEDQTVDKEYLGVMIYLREAIRQKKGFVGKHLVDFAPWKHIAAQWHHCPRIFDHERNEYPPVAIFRFDRAKKTLGEPLCSSRKDVMEKLKKALIKLSDQGFLVFQSVKFYIY